MSRKAPPKLALRFFRWFCDPYFVEDIEGDLVERFEKRIGRGRPAKWLLTLDVLMLFRPGIIRKFEGSLRINNYGMFKHHIKVAFRNQLRQKKIAFIHIGGLVLGLLVTVMIGLWVYDEWSWDKDNAAFDNVVQVRQKRVFHENIDVPRAVPYPLAAELRQKHDDIFQHIVMASNWDASVSHEEDALNLAGVLMESEAPHVLSLQMINGSKDALKEEAAILLSRRSAYALFGKNDPMNQTVILGDYLNMIVRGIYDDIPRTSSFNGIEFIASLEYYVASNDWMQESANEANWEFNMYQLYATIHDPSSIENSNERIKSTINDHLPVEAQNENNAVFLHPMKDWHLRSSWKNGVRSGGGIVYVRWFSIIGLLVLSLACINFMNLSTAQSIRRAKEVGIRKSIGSLRSQLIMQFMTESALLVFLSFLMATGVAYLLMPYFNHLTDKEMSLPIGSWQYWSLGAGLVLMVGTLSGSYPALYLSSFRPIQVLKGIYQSQLTASVLRKLMVVFQFSISIALIIGTIVISQQIDHAINRPLGYDTKSTISIPGTSPRLFEDELKRSSIITHYAESSNPLTETWMMSNDLDWVGKDPAFTPMINTIYVSHDFGRMINWEIVAGRDFNRDFVTDSTGVILNETAAASIGLADPLGKEVNWHGSSYRIIGIVKDLLVDSPFKNIGPTFYFFIPEHFRSFTLLRLNDQVSEIEAIGKVAEIYESVHPGVPFEFEFVSDAHDRKFQSIKRIGSLTSIFSSFAIIISCLGLFGLASFMVEQRTKEIGIRKVLGASVFHLWRLISKEFVALVVTASMVAIPLAVLALKGWLEGYEYRVDLQWWVFVIACLGALALSIVTTSYKALATIRLNPAKTLKDE